MRRRWRYDTAAAKTKDRTRQKCRYRWRRSRVIPIYCNSLLIGIKGSSEESERRISVQNPVIWILLIGLNYIITMVHVSIKGTKYTLQSCNNTHQQLAGVYKNSLYEDNNVEQTHTRYHDTVQNKKAAWRRTYLPVYRMFLKWIDWNEFIVEHCTETKDIPRAY